jgi:serine/threonine protein kinase
MSELTSRLQTSIADRYAIEREVGQGGMATVYLAQDLRHHRSVALKLLHPHLSQSLGPERPSAAAKVVSPRIVDALDRAPSFLLDSALLPV